MVSLISSHHLETGMFFLNMSWIIHILLCSWSQRVIKLIWLIISHVLICVREPLFLVCCFLIIHEWSGWVTSSKLWSVTVFKVLLCRHIMVYGFFTLEGNYTSGSLWPRIEKLCDPSQQLESCINFQSGSKR